MQLFVTDSLQHRLIIFIYKNDYTLSGLLTSTLNDTGKAQGKGCFRRTGAVLAFPIFKIIIQYFILTIRSVIFFYIEIQM